MRCRYCQQDINHVFYVRVCDCEDCDFNSAHILCQFRAEILMKDFERYRRCNQCQAGLDHFTRAEMIATVVYLLLMTIIVVNILIHFVLYKRAIHSYEESMRVLHGTYPLAFQGKVV